jgi:hypothetical protein
MDRTTSHPGITQAGSAHSAFNNVSTPGLHGEWRADAAGRTIDWNRHCSSVTEKPWRRLPSALAAAEALRKVRPGYSDADTCVAENAATGHMEIANARRHA